MKSLGAFLVLPALVALLGSSAGVQTQAALPGSYELVTIDGHPIPYAPNHPGSPADAPPPPTVVASVFTIADSTFQLSMSYRMGPPSAEQTMDRQFSGTYARQDEGYLFTWTGAGRTPVTLRGDTLVLDNEGMLFAYVRRKGD